MKTIYLLTLTFILASCASSEKNQTVDKKSYQVAIKQNKIHFSNCYKELITRLPEAQGKVVMTFSVNPKAEVENIAVEKETSTLTDESFISCMTDALKKVEFKPAPKGILVDIKYPFVFVKNTISN